MTRVAVLAEGFNRRNIQRGILFVFVLILFIFPRPALADAGRRFKYIQRQGFVRVWFLKAWTDNSRICEIFREDDLEPTGLDIRAYCGEKAYVQWSTAAPCTSFLDSGKTSSCSGAFFTYQGYYKRKYSTYIELPQSSISFSLDTCKFGEWCDERPIITYQAKEPLPTQHISRISVNDGSTMLVCNEVSTCKFRAPITANQGAWLDFWAVSSFGDETPHQLMHIRNLYRPDNGGQYRLDLLSEDTLNDFAALTWDMFPAISGPNRSFFEIPQGPADLATSNHLFYLAGRLIASGQISAEDCMDNGLLDNQYANNCGENRAYQRGLQVQNQYDSELIQAGRDYGIPPRLVKAIITQESQAWSGRPALYEFGLGSLTEYAMDLLMTWDTRSFWRACTIFFSSEHCSSGYSGLGVKEKPLLRGYAMRPVGTKGEIDLITRVVRANVLQVNQMMKNISAKRLALVSSYEDMWYFSIGSFHSGNACLAEGMELLMVQSAPVTFSNYCALKNACASACDYVAKVKKYANLK